MHPAKEHDGRARMTAAQLATRMRAADFEQGHGRSVSHGLRVRMVEIAWVGVLLDDVSLLASEARSR